MSFTLEEILQNFEPSQPDKIVNAEFHFENITVVISKVLGNGVDKIVYALFNSENSRATHVLKIFRHKNSLENFQAWQELEKNAKEAILKINETNPLKIGNENWEIRFPKSWYYFVDGWGVEIQEYSEGNYLDELINEGKFDKLYGAINSNDITSILEEADNILEKEPVNPKVLQIKGHYLLSIEKIDEAIENLEEALELDPTLSGIHIELANARVCKGDLSIAKFHARQAAQKNPEYTEPFDILFNIEVKTGNIQNAVVTLDFLKRTNFPPEKLAKMEQQLNVCVKERQEIGSALETAFTSRNKQDYEKLTLVFAGLREKFPTHTFVWYISGTTALSNNDIRSALNYFSEAYRLDFFDLDVVFHLGFAYFANSLEDGATHFLGEWVYKINELLSSIQAKIKEPQNGISILPEEGLFLQSLDNILKNCEMLIDIQNESQNEQMQFPSKIENLLKDVTNLYNVLQDFKKNVRFGISDGKK